MSMNEILGQEAGTDLYYFFSEWLESNEEQREKLKEKAKTLNAKYSGGIKTLLDDDINYLVSCLVEFFAETPMPRLTDVEIKSEIEKLKVYILEKAR